MSEPLIIFKRTIEPQSRVTLNLPLPDLYANTRLDMPVRVVRGKLPGPRLLLNAALHGDEINGAEIIRRLLARPQIARLRGTLIAVPVVNVYGMVGRSRYLPDRRDLNRSFPGSSKGSLAARLANLFVSELLAVADNVIDFHTAAVHRTNLPQIRIAAGDSELLDLARSFAAPVILRSKPGKGTLRREAGDRGIPLLVYEGGEALRFNEKVIRNGVRGSLAVMQQLGMLTGARPPVAESLVARECRWVRAPQSGIMRADKTLGERVDKGDELAFVGDPFGAGEKPVRARFAGLIVGKNRLPLVNEGDALFNIAKIDEDR